MIVPLEFNYKVNMFPILVIISLLFVTISILCGNKIRNPIASIFGLVMLIPTLIFSFVGVGLVYLLCLGGLMLGGLIIVLILSAIIPSINTAEGFGHIEMFKFIFLNVIADLWIVSIYYTGQAAIFFGLSVIAGFVLFFGLHGALITSGFTLVNIMIIVIVTCFAIIGRHLLTNR